MLMGRGPEMIADCGERLQPMPDRGNRPRKRPWIAPVPCGWIEWRADRVEPPLQSQGYRIKICE